MGARIVSSVAAGRPGRVRESGPSAGPVPRARRTSVVALVFLALSALPAGTAVASAAPAHPPAVHPPHVTVPAPQTGGAACAGLLDLLLGESHDASNGACHHVNGWQ